MKKISNSLKKMIFAVIVFVALHSMTLPVYAADFTANVSSASAVTGENVSVTITFSSSVNIGAYAMSLSYDANILEYVSGADGGGGGTLQFYNDYVNQTQKSYTITFKAISAGTSTFAFATISSPCDIDANDMTVKASGGSVTVEAPRVLSTDNYLTSLNVSMVSEDGTTEIVSLNPQFDKETTQYSLSIKANISRLSLDAQTSDTKATIKVSGTRMDPGSNTTTVTVTAEDGSTRKYVIYTEKEVEETTPEETTIPEETTPEESTTPEETTEQSTDTQTPISEITVNQIQYQLQNIPADFQAPEGYEAASIEYQGAVLEGLQGLSTKLLLVYAVEKESATAQLMIYEKEENSFSFYIPLTLRQQVYTILNMPSDIKLPFEGEIGEEYQYTDLEVEGKTVQALSYGAENIYLVYAMNNNAQKQLYYYDKTENTMLRYGYSELENRVSSEDSISANVGMNMKERNLFEKRIAKRNYVIVGMAVVIGVLLVSVIVLFVKNSKKNTFKDEVASAEEEYEDGESDVEEAPLSEDVIDQEIDNILNKK